jgi:hypothetical protein
MSRVPSASNVMNSLLIRGSESVGEDHMQPKLFNFSEFSVNLKLIQFL